MYIPVHSIYGTTMQILPNREGSRKGGARGGLVEMVSYERDQEGFVYLHDMMRLGEGVGGSLHCESFEGMRDFKQILAKINNNTNFDFFLHENQRNV